MSIKQFVFAISSCIVVCSCSSKSGRECIHTGEMLTYHEIITDADGNILPWYSDNIPSAYDDILKRLWSYWSGMKADLNGLPYYMNHLAFSDEEGFIDRGIGGDQIAMMLSSWGLLYNYLGNEKVRENMQFMADYYLAHSLSPEDCLWPDLPFPQNTKIYSGIYDGDMILGPGYTQPDKAGSFGLELLKMYAITRKYPQNQIYLDAAVKIANTLASKVKCGDADNSPWPFKVNVYTGETGSTYTTNYAPTLEFFQSLCEMGIGDTESYRRVIGIVTAWMNEYPVKSNKWGPFFEDISRWSDTQINAVTWAQYLINHPETDPDWQIKARRILDWAYDEFANDSWMKYGVMAINEQTAFLKPGNSHTARQACAELQYCKATGDMSRYDMAIRQLNWATYMVSEKGENRYPGDNLWITDGYGDFVRHYIRAMQVFPELCPPEPHILDCSYGLRMVCIKDSYIYYETAKACSATIKLPHKPASIVFGWGKKKQKPAEEGKDWEWNKTETGGLLVVKCDSTYNVTVRLDE